MKKFVAGLINQKITIYHYEDIANDSAGTLPNLVPYWETNSEVKILKASRVLEANQEKLKPVVIFKIRYRTDKSVIADMSIKWRGEMFSVIDTEVDYVYKEYVNITAIANKMPEK